jgi:hypothetical protein
MKPKSHFPYNIDDVMFASGYAYVKKVSTITVEKMVEQVRKIQYNPKEYSETKDDKTENAQLPPFNLIFFRYVMNCNAIPGSEKFIEECIRNYFEKLEEGYRIKVSGFDNQTCFEYAALKGRIMRTYPSLIRDFYFYLVCLESKQFDEVKYSIYNDYYKGIDLKIVYKRTPYFVSIHVATRRGDSFKNLKYSRHRYDKKSEIVLRLDMSSMEKVGDIYLPRKESLKTLLLEIEKLNVEAGTDGKV